MATSSRYCRHCFGLLRDITRVSAVRSQIAANSRRHFSSPAPTSRPANALRRSQAARFPANARNAPSYTANTLLSRPQFATISTSAPLRRAIINPRKDDDGNDMEIEITARASNRLKAIMDKDSNPDLALRITVESGGCHGFQYLMSLTNMSKIDKDEDTVFEGDNGSKVVMDEPSLDLLKGSKVDYTMELIGSQFKIVDNPLATSSCGCGTSFDIKAT